MLGLLSLLWSRMRVFKRQKKKFKGHYDTKRTNCGNADEKPRNPEKNRGSGSFNSQVDHMTLYLNAVSWGE